jgi:hypothetical protein
MEKRKRNILQNFDEHINKSERNSNKPPPTIQSYLQMVWLGTCYKVTYSAKTRRYPALGTGILRDSALLLLWTYMKLHLRVCLETAWHFENIENPGEAWVLRHCYTVDSPVLYLV